MLQRGFKYMPWKKRKKKKMMMMMMMMMMKKKNVHRTLKIVIKF